MAEIEGDSECPNVKTHFYEFKEYDQLIGLIDSVGKNALETTSQERAFEQFVYICDQYQEQPHLVDKYLASICERLINTVKKNIALSEQNDQDKAPVQVIAECFKYMHCLTKMRGYKRIIMYLPHEINDLEPVLRFLKKQNPADSDTWQTRYMLLIWLSIIAMIPFDLNRFDAHKDDSIMNRILETCLPYLFATDKSQDASAYLLAKFMSRQDARVILLPNFFTRLLDYVNEFSPNRQASMDNTTLIKLLGTLKCIAAIFKYVKREEVLKYTGDTLKRLLEQDLLSTSTQSLALIRKFYIKIIQRVGMAFFRARVAKWRYQRGARILLNNLNQNDIVEQTGRGQEVVEDEDNDDKIPFEIEDIIEQLFTALKDKDTIVRWSAAKGLGRITNRLSKEMAEDVFVTLTDMFALAGSEDDAAWHGACLAIAELGRRGLLLPKQLGLVIPIVKKALVYDKQLGNHSLGRNVRDSACYVCWSLARAFDAEHMRPYVNELAGALLVVTVFDREINCRRAASAAFQENVGRQGQFPHGIDILTKCDYYAVGQLQHCYLNLSTFIADFEEYRQILVDHLIELKLNHWDQSIRDLTGQALYELTKCCPDYMSFTVIPKLIRQVNSIDLSTRYGALTSIAQLIHSLSELSANNSDSLNRHFYVELRDDLKKTLLDKLFEEKYFRGAAGETMRIVVCFFIKKLVLSNIHVTFPDLCDSKFIADCQDFLTQTIEHNKEIVQEAAVDALHYFALMKFKQEDEFRQYVEKLITNVRETSRDYVRSGYCMALGNLPPKLFAQNQNMIKEIISCLCEASRCISGPIDSKTLVATSEENSSAGGWVKARQDAIKSIQYFLTCLFSVTGDLETQFVNQILKDKTIVSDLLFASILHGLVDYSLDSKGDSGSRVREAAIEAADCLIRLCVRFQIDVIIEDHDLIVKLLANIAKQAVERIDRTRCLAGRVFYSLIHLKELKLDRLPFHSQLMSIFVEENIDWNLAHLTLPLFVKLLHIDSFQSHLLSGFVYSVGSLTESLVKPAEQSLLKELKLIKEENPECFKLIMTKLLNLCQSNFKAASSDTRLATSLIKSYDLIVQNSLVSATFELNEQFIVIFLANVKQTKDMTRLIMYIDLFCDLLLLELNENSSGSTVKPRIMSQLMMMLCHSFPRVRKATSSKFFELIMNLSDSSVIFGDNEEAYDECITLLTETDWDQSVEKVREIRNKICDLTKTPRPVLKAKPVVETN